MTKSIICALIVICLGCAPRAKHNYTSSNVGDPIEYEEYIVGVSRVNVPPTIPSEGPFQVRVWAMLGDECHKFSRFEV
jgi:hypothetical protein